VHTKGPYLLVTHRKPVGQMRCNRSCSLLQNTPETYTRNQMSNRLTTCICIECNAITVNV